jgi:diacylglycerol kinase (ATP)
MNYMLFNSKANAGEGKEDALKASVALKTKYGEFQFLDLIDMNKEEFFKGVKDEDMVVITGGDGTLNHLVNDIGDAPIPEKLYLLPLGTGNDFLNDVISSKQEDGLVLLKPFLSKLPVVETMGLKRRFVNGIGYGIDGECCVRAEEMKKEGKTKINYGNITVKLLLTSYVAPKATVTLDGEKFTFPRSYIAAGMNGRYYGGGMQVAPMQKRNDGLLTFVSVYGGGKLGTLMLFPSLFTGKHIQKKKHVFAKRAKVIEVSFDRPTGLQIDGEVVPNATSYKIYFPEE